MPLLSFFLVNCLYSAISSASFLAKGAQTLVPPEFALGSSNTIKILYFGFSIGKAIYNEATVFLSSYLPFTAFIVVPDFPPILTLLE